MAHVIHYQDDIFLIDSLARFVADASNLEIDADIMGDTVYSVIQLADRTLRTVRELVLANNHLVERTEYMRLLANSATILADALQNLLRPNSPMQAAFSLRAEELHAIAKAHDAMAYELKNEISGNLQASSSGDDHVSGDEISELLKS